MTSRHPASFSKYMADFDFSGRITVTELLKKSGYRTGHFGKWHIEVAKRLTTRIKRCTAAVPTNYETFLQNKERKRNVKPEIS